MSLRPSRARADDRPLPYADTRTLLYNLSVGMGAIPPVRACYTASSG